MKRIQSIWLTFILVGLTTSVSLGQVKLAQTGFNFLSLSSDARTNGMGGAVNSLVGFPGAMAANPASMAEMPKFLSASFDMNKWIADINYISASVIVSLHSGQWSDRDTVDQGGIPVLSEPPGIVFQRDSTERLVADVKFQRYVRAAVEGL